MQAEDKTWLIWVILSSIELKTFWEYEKTLVTTSFSFSRDVLKTLSVFLGVVGTRARYLY